MNEKEKERKEGINTMAILIFFGLIGVMLSHNDSELEELNFISWMIIILGGITFIAFFFNLGESSPSNNPIKQQKQYHNQNFKPSQYNDGKIDDFIMNRIVAPVAVSLILGFFSYLFTGNFTIGGGVTIIGSIIGFAVGNGD